MKGVGVNLSKYRGSISGVILTDADAETQTEIHSLYTLSIYEAAYRWSHYRYTHRHTCTHTHTHTHAVYCCCCL